MCEINKGFQLCSCSDVDRSASHWILIRRKEQTTIIGMPIMPEQQFLNNMDLLKTELNKRNCFDFDYQPANRDQLVIIIKENQKEQKFYLDYKDNEFEKGWRSNFVISGKENKPHSEQTLNQGKVA